MDFTELRINENGLAEHGIKRFVIDATGGQQERIVDIVVDCTFKDEDLEWLLCKLEKCGIDTSDYTKLPFRMDFSEVKLTGVLNAEIYEKMSDEAEEEFIRKDAEDRLRKFVSQKWDEDVNVSMEYIVIDYRYNEVNRLHAKTTYNHNRGIGKIESWLEI